MTTQDTSTRRGFLGTLGTILGAFAAVGVIASPAQAGKSRFRGFGGYGGYGGYRGNSRIRYRTGARVPFYGNGYGGYAPRYYGAPAYAPAAPYYAPAAPYYAPAAPYYAPAAPGGYYLPLSNPGRAVVNPLSLLEA